LAVAGHGRHCVGVVEFVEGDSAPGDHLVDHGGEDDDPGGLGFL
jgi:hypothetical protein